MYSIELAAPYNNNPISWDLDLLNISNGLKFKLIHTRAQVVFILFADVVYFTLTISGPSLKVQKPRDFLHYNFKHLIHCALSDSCSKRFFSNYNVEPFILIRDSAVVFPPTSISQIIFQL